MALGQAAGTAAALCCRDKIDPARLAAAKVRQAILDQGGLI
jgi:hypothetical protein